MRKTEKNPILLLSVGLSALFLAGFLLLVIFGAKSYRDIVSSQYGNMDARSLTAYLSASVKANDSSGAVSVEETGYGPALVVTDPETGYALRYYHYNGQLLEDFAPADSPLDPDEAQQIAPTQTFEVERISQDVFSVTTDAGRTLLRVRSEEEAAP